MQAPTPLRQRYALPPPRSGEDFQNSNAWACSLRISAAALGPSHGPAWACFCAPPTHHEHRKLGFAPRFGPVIDKGQHLAQGAHLGPGEMVPEQAENLGIGDRKAGAGRGDQDRAHFIGVGQQPRRAGIVRAHEAGCCATGVSSNTSSFESLCGHGITSRH